MGANAAVHPSDLTLRGYGLGKLDGASAETVTRHLEDCDSCGQRVADLSSDEFLGRLQNAQVKSDKPAAGWSPFGVSSADAALGSAGSPPPIDNLPPELVDHPGYEIVRAVDRRFGSQVSRPTGIRWRTFPGWTRPNPRSPPINGSRSR